MKKKTAVIISIFLAQALYADMRMDAIGVITLNQANPVIARIKARGGRYKNLYLGIVYHNLSQRNPARYLNQALAYMKKAQKTSPSPLAQGYLGSAITMEGGIYSKKGDVVKASLKVEQGTKMIDQAVKRSPGDINLRFLRIGNAIGVSEASPFKRYRVARMDLAFIKPKVRSLDNNMQSLYYYNAGKVDMAENRINQALMNFEKSIAASPASAYARDSRKMLTLLEE